MQVGMDFSLLQLVIAVLTATTLSAEPSKPHIVFILADDLGWNDVSFHGSQQIPTPNIDSLAYDGVILTNYYVQPLCTPTRGALLTGRYPIHTGLQHWVIEGPQPYGLPLNETLLPQYLKEMGYKTHMIGKWHLGFHAIEFTPTRRGFDSHYGYFQAMGDYWDHTMQQYGKHPKHQAEEEESRPNVDGRWGLDFRRNDDIVKTDFGRYSTELFTEEADKIIQQHDVGSPLFLYLPFQAVHSGNPWKPLEAPYYYYEKFSHIQDKNRRTYAAMVSALDDAVGNVTKSLHDRGMLNNTIIVFSTDNGGPAAGFDMNHASNAPLRGTKEGLWEGGVRGAGFIWSSLLKQSQYTSNIMMHVTDWLPTLLSASGYDNLPTNIDGINLWEALSSGPSMSHFQESSKPYVRGEILHNIDPVEDSWAVRVGELKLVYAKTGATKDWNKWYKPESIDENPQTLADQESTTSDQVLPNQTHLTHNFSSTVSGILKELGRPVAKSHPFIVKCGPPPPGALTNCQIWKAPCLYNITADPCEYNNLAEKLPNMVNELLIRLKGYNDSAVAPGNKPADPAAYPMYHGGMWVPWIKLNHTDGEVPS